jgi:hypothetical protein
VKDDTDLPMSANRESRIRAIEHAIMKALPDGWELSRRSMLWVTVAADPGFEWVASSGQVDGGFFQLRLTDDLGTLLFVHSTDIHSPPPEIEEAILIHLRTGPPFTILSTVLPNLMRTRRPNRIHPV